MSQKNTLTIVVVAVVILAIIVLFALKKNTREVVPTPVNQVGNQVDNNELNQAVTADTTTSINDSLDKIKIDEVTGDEDLNIVDQELQKL